MIAVQFETNATSLCGVSFYCLWNYVFQHCLNSNTLDAIGGSRERESCLRNLVGTKKGGFFFVDILDDTLVWM